MTDDTSKKLYAVLNSLENSGKDRKKIQKIRKLVDEKKFAEALKQIRDLNNSNNNKPKQSNSNKETSSVSKKKKRGRKPKKKNEEELQNSEVDKAMEENKYKEDNEYENDDVEKVEDSKYKEENDIDNSEYGEDDDMGDNEYDEDDDMGDSEYDEDDDMSDSEYDEDDEIDDSEYDEEDEKDIQDSNKEKNDEDDLEDLTKEYKKQYGWDDDDDDEVVYKIEEKKQESIYPEKLRNEELEKSYVGMLLNNPKLIVKYYIVFEECFFDDQSLLNIYKSILFTEGGKYTPEIAKKGFNFSVDNNETYKQKQELRMEIAQKTINPEKVYLELRKLCIIRKSYQEEPREDIQERIIDIINYELYDQMSADEVKAAIVQVSVTQKFKQAVLSNDLTSFLEKGDNNLTNGLELPFPILSSVFKGIRKGETMAFAMPSNSGKSRFTIDIAAYTAFIHKKKVLIISNEMSEEKMKLCLITTVINNPEIQKLHGQKLSITEGELLEFKFRTTKKDNKVKLDENGYILQDEKETRAEFVERLKQVSEEFNKTIAVTDWVNSQINNSIYFINITDHTNDELKKVIMNYYYKEKIEYVFYDTLKTDTANIGNGEEIKRTATILSNLAQNFNMFICSTLQLTESSTLPINLTVNDLAVSRTVKEVLDTLCLIKQIPRDNLDDYKYSLEEVDTKFFELKKYDDPDERYYACVVDKNRAGAKPKLLFNLNLAYNRWNELGYLFLK